MAGSVDICVESDRVFGCERCSRQVRVCRRCDHGQRYCRQGCARLARRDTQRRAGARYQGSFRGRLFHARRQGQYRARQCEKVTHHGFSDNVSSASIDLHNTTKEVDDETNEEVDLGQSCLPSNRIGDQRGVGRSQRAERCAWCGAAGQRFVRFGHWRR